MMTGAAWHPVGDEEKSLRQGSRGTHIADKNWHAARRAGAQRVWLTASYFAVFAAMVGSAAAQASEEFECPADEPDSGFKKGDSPTYFCCKPVDWSANWCKKSSCVGVGCGVINGTGCGKISDCLCRGISYKTRSSCTIEKSCTEAKKDYQQAQMAVLEKTGVRVDQFEGCQAALTGVICAYHFPKCVHDLHEQEMICMRTCTKMMETCRRQEDCTAGENVTVRDDKGEPILDKDGNEQTVVCNKTSSALSELASSAGDSLQGFDAAETASSVGGSASSAYQSASGNSGGGRRDSGFGTDMGAGWAALEAQRRAIVMDAIRKWRPDLQAPWRAVASTKGEAVKTRTRALSDDVASTPERAMADDFSMQESRRKEVQDTTKAYWKQFEGKLKLSDFSQVGQRCEHCLTPLQLSLGKMCEKGTPEYTCMYTTRAWRGDCTSAAPPRSEAALLLSSMVAAVASLSLATSS